MLRLPIAVVIVAALALPAEPVVAQSLELPVKAAFIVNFAKFTEWPAGHFPAAGKPIRIGVLDAPGMLDALRRVAGAGSVRGHALEVQPLARAAGFDGQLLYVGPDARREDWSSVAGAPGLLVVADLEAGTEPAAIRFFLKDNTVHFEVSMYQAHRAKLILSSRLLKVARVVQPAGEEH